MKLHPCPEADRPDIQFAANACVATHKNPGGLHIDFNAASGMIDLDFECAFRRLDPRTPKIETSSRSAGVG